MSPTSTNNYLDLLQGRTEMAGQATADQRPQLRLVGTPTSNVNFTVEPDFALEKGKEIYAKVQMMSDSPSREEVNAKLEAVEARLETRLTSMDGKLDRLLDKITVVGETAKEAKTAASTIKWNILITAVATLAALIAVIVALNAVGFQVASVIKQFEQAPAPITSTPSAPITQPKT